MVSLRISYHGIGKVRISPLGTKVNQETYLEILENTYLQDCLDIFGPRNKRYTFMQDNASSHAPDWRGALAMTHHIVTNPKLSSKIIDALFQLPR